MGLEFVSVFLEKGNLDSHTKLLFVRFCHALKVQNVNSFLLVIIIDVLVGTVFVIIVFAELRFRETDYLI